MQTLADFLKEAKKIDNAGKLKPAPPAPKPKPTQPVVIKRTVKETDAKEAVSVNEAEIAKSVSDTILRALEKSGVVKGMTDQPVIYIPEDKHLEIAGTAEQETITSSTASAVEKLKKLKKEN